MASGNEGIKSHPEKEKKKDNSQLKKRNKEKETKRERKKKVCLEQALTKAMRAQQKCTIAHTESGIGVKSLLGKTS